MSEILDNSGESADDRAVSGLLKGLERVDVPNDFDFKLKARIANADPARFVRKRLSPVPFYVFGLAAVLIVGAVFVIRESYFSVQQPVARVVEQPKDTEQEPPLPDDQVSEVMPSNDIAKKPSEPTIPSTNKARIDGDRERPGGSIDSSLGTTNQILPRGFNVNAPRRDIRPQTANRDVSIDDLMKNLGIEARFDGEQLKVTSVHDRSVAERSGIKPGDVILSIDETRLTPSTKLGSNFAAKNLKVSRDGRSIDLPIRFH